MSDPYHTQIKGLIQKHGALGVNSLSKELEIPLSTIQKYMHKQDYFRMNSRRKWDLPDNIAATEVKESISNFDSVIDSQLTGLTNLSELLIAQVKSTITLLTTQKPVYTAGAALPAKSPDIHPLFIEKDKAIKETYALFKKYIPVVPEEYRDLLKNVDLVQLILERGAIAFNNVCQTEIGELFLESSTKLSDETVNLLEEYQKGA